MPVCEETQAMSNDTFAMILVKANTIRREAEGLMSVFQLLGSCHSFQTMPEGSIALAASRLREAADYLDEMNAKVSEARVHTFLYSEAAE
jgi:hypothetical protein